MITLTHEPGIVSFVRNPIYFEFSVDYITLPTNHVVKVKIFFEKVFGSNNFEEIIILEDTVNSNNAVVFDISSIIEAVFERNPQLPPIDNALPYISDNRRKYKIAYTESFGNPVMDQAYTEKTGYFAYWGGIDQARFTEGDFFQDLSATNSLLSFYPRRKQISSTQPEFLKWYNYTGSSKNIIIEINRWDANGNFGAIYLYDTQPFLVQSGETAIFPVGHSQLELLNNILKYTARIVDASS